MNQVFRVAALTTIVVWLAPRFAWAEATGRVSEVSGRKFTGEITGGEFHQGDRVTVFVEIAGVGEAEVATATVTAVLSKSVVADVQKASGRIEPGQQVRVTAAASSLKPPSRWVGYQVMEPLSDVVPEWAKYTNILFDLSWADHGDKVIVAAKKAGIRLVVAFREERGARAIQERAIEMARRHCDAVVAVCWSSPYHNGHTPQQLSAFGRRLKAALPGVEFWCDFVVYRRATRASLPVPDEVDRLVLTLYQCSSAADVEDRERILLPQWFEKAHGRPMALGWSIWDQRPPGIAATCEPGIMRRCAQLVRDHHLEGLMIKTYGRAKNTAGEGYYAGVETSPNLIAEIKEVASGLKADSRGDAVTPGSESRKQ